jgi:phage tail-like protein
MPATLKTPIPVLGTSFVLQLKGFDQFPLMNVSLAELAGQKIEEFAVGKKGVGKSVGVERPKTAEITVTRALRAGTKDAMMLYDWHKKAFTNGYESAIQDGSIIGYDTSRKPVSEFAFWGAWPKSYKWPALDAKGGSFLKEEVVLSCDIWTRVK